MEQWKVYKETTNNRWGHRVYEVSNLGRVKCNKKLLKPRLHGGYLYAGSFPIHRAVAELFIPNPCNKPYIDHIDTNPLNNRVDNLRWVTAKENSNNPVTIYHMKMNSGMKGKHHSSETVERIRQKISGSTRSTTTKKRISEKLKGGDSPFKGYHWKIENGKRIWYI